MGTMTVEQSVAIGAAPDRVWLLLEDLEQLVDCVPNAHLDRIDDDGVCHGTIQVKLGPTRVRFNGQATLEADRVEKRGVLRAVGGEDRSMTRADVNIEFAVGPDRTGSMLDLALTAAFSGPLASVAQSGGARVARGLVQEFAENVAAHPLFGRRVEPVEVPLTMRWHRIAAWLRGLFRRSV